MLIACKKYLNKLFTDVETRSLAWFTGYKQMDPYLVNQIILNMTDPPKK